MPISLEIVRYRPIGVTPFSPKDFNALDHAYRRSLTSMEND
jgi:hypothetical protein